MHHDSSDYQRTRPLISILDTILDIAKATPPVDNKLSRFGNPAFKEFYDRVGEVSSLRRCDLT